MDQPNNQDTPPVTEAQPTKPTTHNHKQLPLIAGAAVIVIIALAVILGAKNNSKTAADTSAKFKDGTYMAEGDYITHIGQKHIGVSITLKNDIITDATVTDEADDPTSVHYQDLFISGYKPEVIGKNIADVQLSKVSGSSLTPNGFNSALKTIEAQAKS